MRRRPFAALLAATALAVAVGGIGVAVAPRAEATAGSVGIVIDYNGTISSSCVAAGGTGDSILNSVASVAYRPRDGLIIKINGNPDSGFADGTHYWAYFHNNGSGGWVYSNVGASGYRPAAGTVEGWRYSTGANPGPPPPARTFASVCGSPPPATTAAPPIVPAPPQTSAVPRASSTPPARTVSAVPQPVIPPASADASTTPASSASVEPSSSASGSLPPSDAGSHAPTSISASPVGARAKGSGGGSLAAVLIGVALVAGLASTAIVIARRRRAS